MILNKILQINNSEIKVSKRKFYEFDQNFSSHIENIGMCFLYGYNNFLKINGNKNIDKFVQKINKDIAASQHGFVVEGAAMASEIMDIFRFINPQTKKIFENEFMYNFEYLIYVGIGWAYARSPFKNKIIKKYSSNFLFPLIYDGYGFHEGFFNYQKHIQNKQIPKKISNKYLYVFDQGIGRSLWFVCGGNPYLIASRIKSFPFYRQGNLWAGLGLSSTYAGGMEKSIKTLKYLSDSFHGNLAQGSAFAVKARVRSKNTNKHTEYACRTYCDMSIFDTYSLVDDIRKSVTSYEEWQQKTTNFFNKKQ